jgi:hypothetical protein
MVETTQNKKSKAETIPEFTKIKDKLPNTLFAKNRSRFVSLFKAEVGETAANKGIAVFKGATEMPLYSSDVCYPEY